jgi:uncharacterized protein (DUF2336 family)
MLGVFKNIFDFKKKPLNEEEAYLKQRDIAANGDFKKRLSIAKNPNTHQEILYYIAQNDPDYKVRKAVVNNASLPLQASMILALDPSEDVRIVLVNRLVSLLPELSEDKHSQIYSFAVQALGDLALDEVLKIRKALSSALKDHAYAPPAIVLQLAKDVEREVSEPILRFCVALRDDDLLEILEEHPAEWVVEAIASRKEVSATLSKSIIDNRSSKGGVALLNNKGAIVSADLFTEIVKKAKDFPEWHEPIAKRKELPANAARELANYANEKVRDILLKRDDLDPVTVAEITQTFKRRFEEAGKVKQYTRASKERVAELYENGRLTEEAIMDALALSDYEFLYSAVALRAETTLEQAKKVFALKAAKPIVAICWKADLSMRFALKLQQDIGHVQPKELIYPKDGSDYPLSEEEMIWQLEFLGVKAA